MKQDKLYCTGKYNPISLNAILFDRRAPFERQIPASVKIHGMWYYSIRIIYAIIKDFIKILSCFPVQKWFIGINSYASIYQGNIVFLVTTTNNSRSLERIIELVCKKKDNVTILNKEDYYKSFPQVIAFFKSVCCCKNLYRDIKQLSYRDRRIVGYYITQFFRASGFYYCCNQILNRFKPECIVTANDHLYDRKIITYLCEELGIKNIYVQHASVSYAFPELHFSYSFLDGEDALNKYTADGKKVYGETILLGAVRYDKLSDYRVNRKVGTRNCIGIAINKLDDFGIASDFCTNLLERFPDITLKIRLHPSIKNNPLNITIGERLAYTNAKDESIIDYLDSIDMQISGDSSVHFDALLGGVPTIAFNFTSRPYGDNYKYVAKGLIMYADNIQQVFDYVDNYDTFCHDNSLIREYDESFGKKYAGHCSEIVAQFIFDGFSINKLNDRYDVQTKDYKGNRYFVIPS